MLAGLALLGTLLVAILLAKSEHQRQHRQAQRTLQAVRAADALLTEWWIEPGTLPRHGEGPVPEQPALRWRTAQRQPRVLEAAQVHIVRLEILRAAQPQAAPLLSVEVLVPDAPARGTEQDEERG